MVRRAMRLPKDQIVEPEDRTGPTDDNDVEGHGFPVTAPPSLASRRGSGHGGEATPTVDDEDDVEGHRIG